MIVLEMVVTEMYLQPPKMVLFVLNVVVANGTNLLCLEDGEGEGVLETVDDCSDCTRDGDNGDVLATTEDGAVCTECRCNRWS